MNEAEYWELNARMGRFTKENGDGAMVGLMQEFSEQHGRIPTPADDGLSGFIADVCSGRRRADALASWRRIQGVAVGNTARTSERTFVITAPLMHPR